MIYLYKKLKIKDKVNEKQNIFKSSRKYCSRKYRKQEAELEILRSFFLCIQAFQNDLYMMYNVYN